MKKIIPLLALISFSAFSADLSLTLGCKTVLQTDGDVATLTEKPVVLSTDGNNSKIFQTALGSDQNNSIVVALQEVSQVCANTACVEHSGTVFGLVLARIEDPTLNALQMAPKAKVDGETSATAQITVMNDGKVTSNFVNNGKLIMNAQGLPSGIDISYKVARRSFKNQVIQVSCSVTP